MLFSNPRVLPALLFCIGLTVLIMRGQELKNMDQWNPDDIDTAVELNFALDQVRRDETSSLSDSEARTRKQEIRQEIEQTFVEPQKKMQQEYEQAKWMTGAGAILLILVLVLQRRGIIKR